MSFVGYMWGGLIRIGYKHNQSGNIQYASLVKDISNNTKEIIKAVIPQTKKDIREKIRTRYTYKGAISIRSRASGTEGTITVKGKRENVKKKFVTKGGRGRLINSRKDAPRETGESLYVSILRGMGGVIPRGFIMDSKGKFRNTAWRRDTGARVPMHMLYGPSTAEMAGHEPMPLKAIDFALQRRLKEKAGGIFG